MKTRKVGWIALGLLLGLGCSRKPLEVEGLAGGRLVTVRPPADIASLNDPPLLTADEADAWMRPSTPVVGYVSEGHAIAVSLRTLDDHEIVNLRFGTEGSAAYAATW